MDEFIFYVLLIAVLVGFMLTGALILYGIDENKNFYVIIGFIFFVIDFSIFIKLIVDSK